jgi:hypothetical protein
VVLTTEVEIGWRGIDREATIQGVWLVGADGESIGDELETTIEADDREVALELLAAWRRGVEWELPIVLPPFRADLDDYVDTPANRTRDEIEAAVRREMPAGERVVWLASPSQDGDWVQADHRCEADYPPGLPAFHGLPPTEEYPTQMFRRVELTLRRFAPLTGPLNVDFYRGRCGRCRTTYLAPHR